ncbi:MAG: Uma2 family endonuclease [Chloroflexota bacterium]
MSSQTAVLDKPRQKRSSRATTASDSRPPLNPGDRLTRAEFERRYQAYPEIKKAELIEGVVYMPSPVRYKNHGQPHFRLIGWLSTYVTATPGISGADNTTVRLDFENEVQPDAILRLEEEKGGLSQIAGDDYLEGPPELMVEIAASSAAYDLHDKKRVCARSGVTEYLVVQMYEQRIDWFALREGVYEPLPADDQGLIRSEQFPGLWLDTAAFWNNDMAGMLATLQ